MSAAATAHHVAWFLTRTLIQAGGRSASAGRIGVQAVPSHRHRPSEDNRPTCAAASSDIRCFNCRSRVNGYEAGSILSSGSGPIRFERCFRHPPKPQHLQSVLDLHVVRLPRDEVDDPIGCISSRAVPKERMQLVPARRATRL